MRAGRLALLLSGALSGSPVQAGPDFDLYVASLKEQALAAGMLPETVSAAFADVHLVDAAIRHDKNQPEFKLTLDTYIPGRCRNGKSSKPKPYIASICRCSQK